MQKIDVLNLFQKKSSGSSSEALQRQTTSDTATDTLGVSPSKKGVQITDENERYVVCF